MFVCVQLQKQVEELTRTLALANTIIASSSHAPALPVAPASPEASAGPELSGAQYMSPFLMDDDDANRRSNNHDDNHSGESPPEITRPSDSDDTNVPTNSTLESTPNQAFGDSAERNDISLAKDEDAVVVDKINRENSKCTEPEADLFAPSKGGAPGSGDWEEIFKDVSSFSEHDLPRSEDRVPQDAVRTALDDAFPEGGSGAADDDGVRKDKDKSEKHKAGFLFKRGWVNTAFKLRWCVIKGDSIYYFKRTSDKEPRGKICCLDARVDLNTKDAQNPDTPFAFSLLTPYDPHHRSWVLQATSLEERDDWVGAIQAISGLPPPGSHLRITTVRNDAASAPSSPQREGAGAGGTLVPVSSPNAKLAVAASVCSIS
jgi:hypothetical protein